MRQFRAVSKLIYAFVAPCGLPRFAQQSKRESYLIHDPGSLSEK